MVNLYKDVGLFGLPDLREIQLEGFRRFVENDLLEELGLFPKLIDPDEKCEFILLNEKYQLGEPLLNEREAVYQATTYRSDLYVPVQLTYKNNQQIQTQTVFLGSLPLMTSTGTFIINGISRIIVNQILRNPGIYYSSEINYRGISVYTATIISDWGERFKIEIDGKKRIWARLTRKCRVPVIILLLAMGLELNLILDQIGDPKLILNSLKKKKDKNITSEILTLDSVQSIYDIPSSMEEAIRELYIQLYPIGSGEPILQTLQDKLFYKKCELGQIGRLNINRRLNLDVSIKEIFLLPKDLLTAVNYLIQVSQGKGYLDDIDHLRHKRVRSVADLLRGQLKVCLNRLAITTFKVMRRAIKHNRLLSPKRLMSSAPFVINMQDLFTSNPLCQFADQYNPLSEMVHKRKLSVLGPGGLTRRTASFRVRDIHPSHYGRICPIETSEGMNAGLIASLATHARINSKGSIESPLYMVSKHSMQNSIVYMLAGEDESYRIATGNNLALDIGSRHEQTTPARYQQEFITTPWYQIHFRSIFPFQYFSVGASLIPFLEHNDANRALMGSNMQRQALPLTKPERPIVGTGLEAQVALDSGTVMIAIEDGSIVDIDSNIIKIQNYQHKESITKLLTYQRSNAGTCLHQRPAVQLKDTIRKGQILAEGAATANGELALGKNVLVAYMPWEGYNFEDAVLINERLVYEDVYTSMHIQKYEIEAGLTSQGAETITKEIPHLDEYVLRHLDDNGLVSVGAWVETGDVLVGKLTPQESDESLQTPEGKLLQAIYGLQVSSARETCLKVPSGGRGRVIDVRWVYQELSSLIPVRVGHVYVMQTRKIQVGDKVAGRHGNKGIVSRILPREDMPYMQNGTPIDIVLSPLGVPSRMNVGQVFECILGLAGNLLNTHYRITPFDERYEREASRKLVFSELYRAKEASHYPWVFEMNNPGKSRLFDGRTGEMFDQPITVGQAYMLKLLHQVDDKIHARSSGPYALITQQPLRGRSRKGGQRMGEMEVWALEGFGASHVLQEMLTIKSDHMNTRSQILDATVTGIPIPKPLTTDVPESFRLLIRELRCLGMRIDQTVISDGNRLENISS